MQHWAIQISTRMRYCKEPPGAAGMVSNTDAALRQVDSLNTSTQAGKAHFNYEGGSISKADLLVLTG